MTKRFYDTEPYGLGRYRITKDREILGQCTNCKEIIWDIYIDRRITKTVDFYNDIKYDQSLLNKVFYLSKDDALIHLKCGGTVKLFRMN